MLFLVKIGPYLMDWLEKMAKNLALGLILAPLTQIWALILFVWILPLLDVIHCASYNCIQFKRKLIDKTWENGQKPSFGPKFGSQIFFVDFNFTTCQKLLQAITICNFKELMNQTSENGKKPSFSRIWFIWPKFASTKKIFSFFWKI